MSKIEVGKTYLTQNGRSVRIIATDRMAEYPIVGLLHQNNSRESVDAWTAEGLYNKSVPDHDLNIIIPPERKSGWLNWYGTDNGAYVYRTRNDAELGALSGRTHVLEIITEDNEPVDVKIHKVEK